MKNKTLNEIAEQVHSQAVAMGWHNFETETEGQFITRMVANGHAEHSELWEAYRNGTLIYPCDKAAKMRESGLEPLTNLEEELADIIIRTLDAAGRLKVDIARAVESKHRYNATRGHRHGGKIA
jgi:NTP pyrophosphatase (non-canonical NTP hydrolase)